MMFHLAPNSSRNLDLKKHVNAIHCTNNLTLVQRKLFNALLFNAYPELPHKNQFRIKSKDLCQLIGYNSKDIGKLREALLGLITIAIEWNVINTTTGKESSWKASSILASAELSAGWCEYEYSQVMRDLLYQPEIYARINLALVSQFKSSYGLALYENCVRFQGLSQTPWFSYETFRKLMGVFDDKYSAFKDFKKRVLDIAVNEVNLLAPLTIVPELTRENQKVTQIRFKLLKVKTPVQANLLPDSLDDLNALLVETFGYSSTMLAEIHQQYQPEYIREKATTILESDSFTNGKIRDLAGYLTQALKKDYQSSRSSRSVLRQRSVIAQKEVKDQLQNQDNKLTQYQHYLDQKVATYLEQLSDAEKIPLQAAFILSLKTQSSIIQGWYRKKGLEHPGIRACLYSYVREHCAMGPLLKMDEYVALFAHWKPGRDVCGAV